MLYTPHFLTGAAIVSLIPNPWVSFPLAFISHFALDIVPHNDFDLHPGVTFKEMLAYPPKRKLYIFGTMAIDAVLMGLFWLWIVATKPNWMVLSVGGLVGISPDLFEQILLLLGVPLLGFQNQWQFRVPAKYGFLSYPIVCIFALVLLHGV